MKKSTLLPITLLIFSSLALASNEFSGTVNYMIGTSHNKEITYPILLIKKNGKTDFSDDISNQLYLALNLKGDQIESFKKCIGKVTTIDGELKKSEIFSNTKYELNVSNLKCSDEVYDSKWNTPIKDRLIQWGANCYGGFLVRSELSLNAGNKGESYYLSKVSNDWARVTKKLGKDFHMDNVKIDTTLESAYKTISTDVSKNGVTKLNSVTGRCNMLLDTDNNLNKIYSNSIK